MEPADHARSCRRRWNWGLTAALALEKRGHTVTVAEQSGVISEVGAGLQLSPNAMKVLNALGVGARVMTDAFRPQAAEMRWGRSAGPFFPFPCARPRRTAGARNISMFTGQT